MNADIFAEWLRRQGHRIVRTPSSYWCDQGLRVYQAFPYHWLIQPTEQELSRFLSEHQAVGLRYSTVLQAPVGLFSYHAVLENSNYDFEHLGKWARKNVRRGLKHCVVQPISFERLAEEGWELQRDTLNRQGRQLKATRETWQQRCRATTQLPGFEAWGALVEGRLAASVITFQMQNCAYLLYQQCRRDYLERHVNNALSFVVTQTLITRPGVDTILYGLHSLDAPAQVDEFKFRMGYQPKPVRQRVVFHPALTPFLNRASEAAARQFLRWRPGSSTLSKGAGLIRFYLQGQQPLEQQTWPDCLRPHSVERLET